MTIICGIDPGQKGGVAFIDSDNVVVVPMPSIPGLIDLFREWSPDVVYLEKAQAMPSQGCVSMFNYGDHFGQLQGVLIALMIRYVLVPPRTWTKVIHAGCTGDDAKEKSLQAVQRLFPTVDLLATDRSRVPHQGLIDALLIAEYGRRVHVV